MDGLFEILIILVIFLLPALEGMIKRRKQGGAGTKQEGTGPGEGSTRGRGEGRRAGSGVAPGPERAETGSRSVEAGSIEAGSAEDRSAEELLPDDLWAILTGQERPTPRAETPEEPSSTSLERGEPAGSEAVDAAPGGADLGGMMSGEPSYDSDSYGYDVGGYGAEAEPDSYESTAAEGPEATEPTRADVFGELDTGPDVAEGAGAGALTRAGASGTSGLRRSRASELQQIRPGRMARRGADAGGRDGGLHPFFEGLNRRELRRAIVLQEVLGPPLGLRDGEVLGPPPGLRTEKAPGPPPELQE